MDNNCGFFINSNVLGQSTFFLLTLYYLLHYLPYFFVSVLRQFFFYFNQNLIAFNFTKHFLSAENKVWALLPASSVNILSSQLNITVRPGPSVTQFSWRSKLKKSWKQRKWWLIFCFFKHFLKKTNNYFVQICQKKTPIFILIVWKSCDI